jgi:hypothetical protein
MGVDDADWRASWVLVVVVGVVVAAAAAAAGTAWK